MSLQGRGPAVALVAVLLVAGTVATVNPLLNLWYFVGVRPAAMRGAAMPVPAGRRTDESENLTGLTGGPHVEQLTDRRLGAGDWVRVVGPAAIVVLDGQASITANGQATGLSAPVGNEHHGQDGSDSQVRVWKCKSANRPGAAGELTRHVDIFVREPELSHVNPRVGATRVRL